LLLAGLKEERVAAEAMYADIGVPPPAAGAAGVDKAQLVADVRAALYASKVCSYAQGYNIIRAKSLEREWDIDLGGLARIWKGGCIIRAGFLDRIKQAYQRNAALPNLLVDPEFAKDLADRQDAWRRVVQLAVGSGIAVPGMMSSLAYFDTYRRGRLPASLVQVGSSEGPARCWCRLFHCAHCPALLCCGAFRAHLLGLSTRLNARRLSATSSAPTPTSATTARRAGSTRCGTPPLAAWTQSPPPATTRRCPPQTPAAAATNEPRPMTCTRPSAR
jgi:6-phosphogluconate dehydrogenase